MPTWEERVENIERLLKLETVPLGIRIIEDEKEIPSKARRPSDFNLKMALCQLTTISRRLLDHGSPS